MADTPVGVAAEVEGLLIEVGKTTLEVEGMRRDVESSTVKVNKVVEFKVAVSAPPWVALFCCTELWIDFGKELVVIVLTDLGVTVVVDSVDVVKFQPRNLEGEAAECAEEAEDLLAVLVNVSKSVSVTSMVEELVILLVTIMVVLGTGVIKTVVVAKTTDWVEAGVNPFCQTVVPFST